MIVPEYYIEFLKKRDTFGYLASLNENHFCDVCRTSGVYVENQEFLKIFYMPALSPRLMQNLLNRNQLTLTVVSAFSFECYQLKGKYISHENISVYDEEFKNMYLKGMAEAIKELGFNLENVLNNKYILLEVVTIIMKVEEVYEQTPKKGTGNKIKFLKQAL